MTMNEDSSKRIRALNALERALDDWTRRGNEQPLTRWLKRELDQHGAPIHLAISDWRGCLRSVLRATSIAGTLPSHWTGPITRLIQAMRWFSRKDGRPVIHFDQSRSGHFADATTPGDVIDSNGPGVEQIIERLVGKAGSRDGDDARVDWGGAKCVLDVLRPGWPTESDFLAVDHRDLALSCRVELFGAGRSWLGPSWQIDTDPGASSVPRPQSWISDSSGALAEWSYRAGEARVTPSAWLSSEHSLALLSVLVEDRSTHPSVRAMSVSLCPGIAAAPIDNCRGVALRPPNGRGTAQVLPIGLPSLPYETERGAFDARNDSLVLKQASAGRRTWLPLLVSWDAKRHRKDVHWRVLSVSEKSRNVPPDRAFAVRVSWGKNETYIIYRSLAKPAPRAFIGHQTTARFLLGRFNHDGVVEPILTVD
jgi:hypothetical protein